MAKRKRPADSHDWLSDLPDCLLHDILSHLKARELVPTCLLSRRWRHLWLAVPSLDIDEEGFAPPRLNPDVHAPPFRLHLDRIDDFVDGLLLRRAGAISAGAAPPLDTLRLSISSSTPWPARLLHSYRDPVSCAARTRWLRRGLKYCAPAALHVTGIKPPPLSSSSGTHRLTKLRLHAVAALDSDFQKHITFGLPVLQDLEIVGTDLTGISRIASSTLKNLAVDSSSQPNARGRLSFVVMAPRLASLRLTVRFQTVSVFGVTVGDGAPSLVHASIRFLDKVKLREQQEDRDPFYKQDNKELLTACDLLASVSNVTCLELSGFQDMALRVRPLLPVGSWWPFPVDQIQQKLPSWDDYLPRPMLQAISDLVDKHNKLLTFQNLKTLVIDKCEIGENTETLCRFLHTAPSLEKLTLSNCQVVYVIKDTCNKFPYGLTPNILEMGSIISKLKLVEIKYDDRGDDHQSERSRRINKIVSMVKMYLPATTVIHVTKD